MEKLTVFEREGSVRVKIKDQIHADLLPDIKIIQYKYVPAR